MYVPHREELDVSGGVVGSFATRHKSAEPTPEPAHPCSLDRDLNDNVSGRGKDLHQERSRIDGVLQHVTNHDEIPGPLVERAALEGPMPQIDVRFV
jgi:hypothetical protein